MKLNPQGINVTVYRMNLILVYKKSVAHLPWNSSRLSAIFWIAIFPLFLVSALSNLFRFKCTDQTVYLQVEFRSLAENAVALYKMKLNTQKRGIKKEAW